MKGLYFLFLVFATQIHAQINYIDYYKITNEAEYHFDQQSFDVAENLLLKAFDLPLTPKWKDVILLTQIFDKNEEKKKLIFPLLLQQLKATGGTEFKMSTYLKHIEIHLSDKDYEQLDACTTDTNSERYKTISALNNSVNELHKRDQKYRNLLELNKEVYFEELNITVSAEQAVFLADSINFSELKSLFVNQNLSDYFLNNYKLDILILHLTRRFFDLEYHILDMVKKGNFAPFCYAQAKDRALSSAGMCPQFMAYTFYFKKAQCIDKDEVIRNRRQIGLSPYYFMGSFHYYLSPENKLKISLDQHLEKVLVQLKGN